MPILVKIFFITLKFYYYHYKKSNIWNKTMKVEQISKYCKGLFGLKKGFSLSFNWNKYITFKSFSLNNTKSSLMSLWFSIELIQKFVLFLVVDDIISQNQDEIYVTQV